MKLSMLLENNSNLLFMYDKHCHNFKILKKGHHFSCIVFLVRFSIDSIEFSHLYLF